jgi:hypothetical protein
MPPAPSLSYWFAMFVAVVPKCNCYFWSSRALQKAMQPPEVLETIAGSITERVQVNVRRHVVISAIIGMYFLMD